MLTSLLSNWFTRPAKRAAPDTPPIDAPALPVPHPWGAAVAVEVSHTADGIVVRVKGEPQLECAGALMNGLFAFAAPRPAVVTLDLSGLHSISCLGLGVLVAYRRAVVRAGGRVRLAGVLQPAVKESLVRAKRFDLFETEDCRRTRQHQGLSAVL
jgi:anti-anti-sigma factor